MIRIQFDTIEDEMLMKKLIKRECLICIRDDDKPVGGCEGCRFFGISFERVMGVNEVN